MTIGFAVEGRAAPELPENLLCAVEIHRIDWRHMLDAPGLPQPEASSGTSTPEPLSGGTVGTSTPTSAPGERSRANSSTDLPKSRPASTGKSDSEKRSKAMSKVQVM